MRAMPQAIDRSLATPMMRPRLPAIRGPGFAMSISVMGCPIVAPKARLTSLTVMPGAPQECRGHLLAAATLQYRYAIFLTVQPAEHERRVGSSKAEAVGHDAIKANIVEPFAHDRDILERRVELVDVGALADESVVHHQQRED